MVVATLTFTAAVTRQLLPDLDADAFVVNDGASAGVGVAGGRCVGVAVAPLLCVFVGVAVGCWRLPLLPLVPPESVPPGAQTAKFRARYGPLYQSTSWLKRN